MNTHPGNGRQMNPGELKPYLEDALNTPVLIPGDAETMELLQEKEATSPLKAPYEAAMTRIAEKGWDKKPEEKPTPASVPTETSVKTPLAEALSGSAPATPIEVTPATPSETTSSVETSASAENPFTKEHAEAKRIYEEVAQRYTLGTADTKEFRKASLTVQRAIDAEKKWNKEKKLTPETRMEAIQKKLGAMSSEGLEYAKKAGPYTLEKYRDAGEFYKKQPFKTKILLSVGLLGLGVGASVVGGTVGVSVASAAGAASFAQRLFGSAATFIAVERALKAAGERENLGKERSDAVRRRHTTEALIAAALVGGGALGYAMQHWNNWEAKDLTGGISKAYNNIAEKISTPASAATEGTNANIPAEVAPTPTEYIVPQGGTVWGGLTEKLNMQSSFSGLQEGQKSYVIDVLKNKLATMSEADLKAMGISSGNIDKINVGEKINFNAFLSNQELIQKATEHASSLSGEQIQNIETNPGINITPEAGPVPAEILPSTLEATPPAAETLPSETMPQGMTPASPEIIAEANKTLKVDLDRILGKTGGFLGLGGTHGIESTHWKNPEFGFANKTVDEVLQAAGRPNGLLPNGGKVGIENYDKLTSMQKYLNDVKTFSGLTPAPGEKVEEFIKRGAIKMLEQNAGETPKMPENTPTPIPAEIVPQSTYVETAPAPQSIVPEKLETTNVTANETVSTKTIELSGAKGTFSYSPDGSISGFVPPNTSTIPEGEAYLNNNWRQLVRAKVPGSLSDFKISLINADATKVADYQKVLQSLEENGQGSSKESVFVKEQIGRIIRDTEKTYGDIFKN
jgi:hypothetical protein